MCYYVTADMVKCGIFSDLLRIHHHRTLIEKCPHPRSDRQDLLRSFQNFGRLCVLGSLLNSFIIATLMPQKLLTEEAHLPNDRIHGNLYQSWAYNLAASLVVLVEDASPQLSCLVVMGPAGLAQRMEKRGRNRPADKLILLSLKIDQMDTQKEVTIYPTADSKNLAQIKIAAC